MYFDSSIKTYEVVTKASLRSFSLSDLNLSLERLKYQVEKSFTKSLTGLADSKTLKLSRVLVPFSINSLSLEIIHLSKIFSLLLFRVIDLSLYNS